MSEYDNSEAHAIMSAYENNIDTESKTRIMTKEVDEQIRNCIILLTRQPGYLTRLIQRMSTGRRPNLSPKTGTGASYSATGVSPGNHGMKTH